MKSFIPALTTMTFLLSFSAHADEAGAPPTFKDEWRVCEKTTDCQLLDSGCGWVGVHNKHRVAADKYYKTITPMMDCEATPKTKPTLECKEKVCTVGPGARASKPKE